jgi:hypothetical protein
MGKRWRISRVSSLVFIKISNESQISLNCRYLKNRDIILSIEGLTETEVPQDNGGPKSKNPQPETRNAPRATRYHVVIPLLSP